MSEKCILKLAYENNGVVTSAKVSEANISRNYLAQLVKANKLEKVSRGVYTLPDVWEDKFLNAQVKYKKGIFSLGTALYLHGFTDRTPMRLHFTFPEGYNTSAPLKNGFKCNKVKKDVFEFGVEEVKTPSGNLVRAYYIERTLCDIVKTTNRVEIQVITDAFKQYMSSKSKNIPLLSSYAKLLKVDKKIRPYLEVLQ